MTRSPLAVTRSLMSGSSSASPGSPAAGFPPRDRIALVASLAAPFLVALVLVPFRTDLSNTNAALVLVVTVIAVAAVAAVAAAGNRTEGALAALSAAVWFDFFLTRPYQRFTVIDSEDIETAMLLLAVGLVVSQLAARARRPEAITVTDAAHLARIHERPNSPGPPRPRTRSSTTSATN